MNNLAKINNQELTIKEYQGQRVVTFKDIDRLHERPDGTAKRNFGANKRKFVEGEDYFKVCENEIRTNKIIDLSPKCHGDTILLTESGYLMLVKSFTDDLAWKVQRELVKCYFKVQEQQELFIPSVRTYLGEDVATIKDVAYTLGRSENNIRYLLTKCTRNEDYILLVGKQLAHFKEQNPGNFLLAGCLVVIFKRGFRKICDMLGESFTKFDLFPVRRSLAKPKDNPEIQGWIDDIQSHMDTLELLLFKYGNGNPERVQESLKEVLISIGSDIWSSIFELVKEDYKLAK